MIKKNQYNPDYVSPPGETIEEILNMLNMSQADLARRLGFSSKTVNEIVKGKAPITSTSALKLELVTGIPARFWNNRENNYREYLARLAEKENLVSASEWLRNFPINEMIKRKWIPKADTSADQIRSLLQYFGIASIEQWEKIWSSQVDASYRQSKAYKANPYALASWIRQGEIQALGIKCAPYSACAFKEVLYKLRDLTNERPEAFCNIIQNECSDAGVAVAFVPELPRILTFGVTKWLTPDKALIELSLRYKTNDHLWFTFFHEAAHILFHGKRTVFIDENDTTNDEKEREADEFASNILIPYKEWEEFKEHKTYMLETEIKEFALKKGIHPGIIVGRLQHEGLIPYNKLNHLKMRLHWVSSCDDEQDHP